MTTVKELERMKAELARRKGNVENLERDIKIIEASLKAQRYGHNFKRGQIYKHPRFYTEYRGFREAALVRVTKMAGGVVYYSVQDVINGKLSMSADYHSNVEDIRDKFVYMGESLQEVERKVL